MKTRVSVIVRVHQGRPAAVFIGTPPSPDGDGVCAERAAHVDERIYGSVDIARKPYAVVSTYPEYEEAPENIDRDNVEGARYSPSKAFRLVLEKRARDARIYERKRAFYAEVGKLREVQSRNYSYLEFVEIAKGRRLAFETKLQMFMRSYVGYDSLDLREVRLDLCSNKEYDSHDDRLDELAHAMGRIREMPDPFLEFARAATDLLARYFIFRRWLASDPRCAGRVALVGAGAELLGVFSDRNKALAWLFVVLLHDPQKLCGTSGTAVHLYCEGAPEVDEFTGLDFGLDVRADFDNELYDYGDDAFYRDYMAKLREVLRLEREEFTGEHDDDWLHDSSETDAVGMERVLHASCPPPTTGLRLRRRRSFGENS